MRFYFSHSLDAFCGHLNVFLSGSYGILHQTGRGSLGGGAGTGMTGFTANRHLQVRFGRLLTRWCRTEDDVFGMLNAIVKLYGPSNLRICRQLCMGILRQDGQQVRCSSATIRSADAVEHCIDRLMNVILPSWGMSASTVLRWPSSLTITIV